VAKRGAGRPPAERAQRSQRQLRVGEELRHRLAAALERGLLNDPALAGVTVTVSEVKVSPDLTNATAFVTPLGGTAQAEVVAALNRAAGFLRHLVSEDLGLRVSPRLAFAADRSFDAASRIDAILRHPRVAQDLAQPEGSAGEGPDDGAA